MSEQNPLFRKAALDKLASPERLDVLMQVTSPKGWLALLMMGIILSSVAMSQASRTAQDAAQTGLINDPRVIPAQFAFNTDNRRVATMPGALLLES